MICRMKQGSIRSQTLSSVDAAPLKRPELVRFALRSQSCCSAVYVDVSSQLIFLLAFSESPHASLKRVFLNICHLY